MGSVSSTVRICFFSWLLLPILFFSCKGGKSGNGGIEESDFVTNLEASYSGESVVLVWQNVETAEHHHLFRKAGNGEYTEIEVLEGNASTFTDNNPEPRSNLVYAIRSETNTGELSPLSVPSPVLLPLHVLGTQASLLEFDDRIRISWNTRNADDSYALYRLETAGDLDPVLITETGGNFFDDLCSALVNPPDKGVPCFYRVVWKDSEGLEHGTLASLVPGLADDFSDPFEPNDIISDLDDQNTTTVFTGSNPGLYSFSDGDVNLYQDTDWYLYENDLSINSVSVTVTFPTDTGFQPGDVEFCFWFDGQEYEKTAVTIPDGTPGYIPDLFVFPPAGLSVPSGIQKLYYCIRVVRTNSVKVTGQYAIDVDDGL
jgi:hypothetical protein